MRLLSRFAAGLVFLAVAAAPSAAATPSPLRLVPDSADVLVQVQHPRRLLETVQNLDAVKKLQQFPYVQELLDSTNGRRYYQLLAYFEKELGAQPPELLDRLAGGGVVLAGKFGDNAPFLLVVQGKDEKLLHKFADTALDVIDQELARQDVKGRPTKTTVGDVDLIEFGDFHAAVAGSALILSNNQATLQTSLDLYSGKSDKSMAKVASVAEAAALLPPDPLVSLWLNFDAVKQTQPYKDFYANRQDVVQTIAYGGIVDILDRSSFVCAALCQDKDGLLLTARLPHGRDNMGPVSAIFTPPEGKPGCRPPLAPPGVLYSESFYLDPAPFWTDRDKLFNPQTVKGIEENDKNSGRFLSGLRLSKLLTEAGPYHRIVVVDQASAGYKTTPKTHIPAFAIVTEMRDPEAFGDNMETVLRGAALLAQSQVKMKMTEEKYQDCTITTYRFSEESPLKGDVNDIRFNFTPSFSRVGNQFVASSTTELCRTLVDELQKEQQASKEPGAGTGTVRQARLVAAGAADLLKSFEDTLVTQNILDEAVSPSEAQAQVKALVEFVRGLGEIDLEQDYAKDSFRYDLRWKTK
ncbi:MAG TPA: hypothetical protein VMS17_02160 [Gemmataceae bacterium]|nr:hypothetical protein [Gemmataceae bacterium]